MLRFGIRVFAVQVNANRNRSWQVGLTTNTFWAVDLHVTSNSDIGLALSVVSDLTLGLLGKCRFHIEYYCNGNMTKYRMNICYYSGWQLNLRDVASLSSSSSSLLTTLPPLKQNGLIKRKTYKGAHWSASFCIFLTKDLTGQAQNQLCTLGFFWRESELHAGVSTFLSCTA